VLLAVLLGFAGGCSTTPADEDQAAAVDDEIVCKTERQLGSTFKRRTCKTIAEWREEREAAKELALTRRPDLNNPGSVAGLGRE
jgi:hypothetical protein